MAKTSSCSIGVTVEGDGETCTYVPPACPVQNTSAPVGGTTDVALAAGANTITLPTNAIGVIISPPLASSNVKILKGVAGDTGFALRPNAPSVFYFGTGVAAFDIDSAAIETVTLHWL